MSVDLLSSVSIFAELPREDLERVAAGVKEVTVAEGHVLFAEGEPGAHAFVIVEGELEVVKETDNREVLLAVRGPGDVIGEMALIDAKPRSATVRARSATHLLSIPKLQLDDLLATSPTAAKALFGVLLERWRETEARLRQSERMAQLGTLTAGLAHELNNPAAAVKRSVGQLEGAIGTYGSDLGRLRAAGLVLDDPTLAHLVGGESNIAQMTPLQRADAEADVEDRLDDLGADEAWRLAAALVEAGLGVDEIDEVVATHGAVAPIVLAAVASTNVAFGLLREIQEGATRLSAIVGALKSYSYLDQAPVQEVDVSVGLDDTLLILKHKLGDVVIKKEYNPETPRIMAHASELNQVWTNLIDNAIDAVVSSAAQSPTIMLSVGPHDGGVVVSVADNGGGIPADVQARVFDAFFTTKDPGVGTGLGLDISYGIVVHKHGGEIVFDSEPGRTVFRVTLPTGKDREASDGTTEVASPDMSNERTLCEELANVSLEQMPEGGCVECLEIGDTWVHLRYCVTCAGIRCCDDSKNRHARKHAEVAGHPVVRSREPGEHWAWCYPHDAGVRLPPG